MYQVEITKQAAKGLKRFPATDQKHIYQRLKSLERNPRPKRNLKRLKHPMEGWRLRVGKLRILYAIDEKKKLVKVYRIGFRGGVYR